MNELPDTADALQAKETAHKVPAGWWALFFGLILWGIYYAYTYTPSLGGWSQAGDYEASVKVAASASAAAVAAETSQNITATILFTVIATAVAIFLAVGAARRKKG